MPLKTAAEMAAILRVHKRTLMAWVREGRVPVVKLTARTFRFEPEEVVKALKARK